MMDSLLQQLTWVIYAHYVMSRLHFSGCGVLQRFSKLHHLWILSDLLSYMPFFPCRTLITLDFDGIYLQSCIALLLK